MARRALAVVGKGMAGLAGASVLGVAGYAEYEPGFKRELAFWGRVVPPLAEYWWDYYRNDRAGYERLHEKYAPKALQGILDLGGMYIKFGQVCSVRPEFVPKAYRDAFRKLQSEVENPCTFDDVRSVIEAAFGKKLEDVFSEFDPEPIGRASIGQAHKATLAETGEEVVVKVQYPDAKWKFEADIRALKNFVTMVDSSAEPLYNEFARQFLLELDYDAEARNLDDVYTRVSPFYAGRVNFPKLFKKYCSPQVVTMSLVPGVELETEVRRRLQMAGVPHISLGKRSFKPQESQKDPAAESGLVEQERRDSMNAAVKTADVKDESSPNEATSESTDEASTDDDNATPEGGKELANFVGRAPSNEKRNGGAAGSFARSIVLGAGMGPLLAGARFIAWVYDALVGLTLFALRVASPALRLIPGPLRRLDDWAVEFAAERKKRAALSFTGDTIKLLADVHGYEIFRARIFNADPHPGNVMVDSNQRLGLIDYGQCKRLTLAQARPLAHLILAVRDEEDDETVAAAMRACGFQTKNDSTVFLASFGRLLFSKIQPHAMDHKWHRELHSSDQFTEFPQFALMVARVSGILRGIGLTFMHNLNMSELWGEHAEALLAEGDDAVDYPL